MSTYKISSLPISGYGGEQLPNTYFNQTSQALGLALILPGLRYTGSMPLLYYSTRMLLNHGLNVLVIDADYTRPTFQATPRLEQASWMVADAQAALEVGQSDQVNPHLILIGKSIGTLTLAHLLNRGRVTLNASIWITPLLHHPNLVNAAMQCKDPALFVCGAADVTCDPSTLEHIRTNAAITTFIADGADHSLEVPDDVFRSLQNIIDYLKILDGFLTQARHLD